MMTSNVFLIITASFSLEKKVQGDFPDLCETGIVDRLRNPYILAKGLFIQ